MKLKNDTRLRKRLFVKDAMAHPAKGHLGLWEAIIHKYTEPGDVILDPMAGVGATLTAALMGRHVICNEMEEHFVKPMQASWFNMSQHPMLGFNMGHVVIVRGDARHLPLNSADSVITSPPYEGMVSSERSGIDEDKVQPKNRRPSKRIYQGEYSFTKPVDSVITSPPYEGVAEAQRHPGDELETLKVHV